MSKRSVVVVDMFDAGSLHAANMVDSYPGRTV